MTLAPHLPVPRPPMGVPPLPLAFGGGTPGGAVLVTGAGGPAGIAVIRRLVALGHRVVAGDADGSAAGGYLAQHAVILPRADHPRFLDAVLGASAAFGVDALVSTVAEELPALAVGSHRLAAAGVGSWLPDPAAVELCSDKAAFARRMDAVGIPHPRTAADAAALGNVPGPWVVKPRTGRGSRGVQLLEDPAAVHTAMTGDRGLIAQTRLAGREFTADVLVDREGHVLTVVPRWRDEVKAGISVKGTTFSSEAVTDLACDALTAVGLSGPANLQGFVSDDGAVTLMEINPRFSGGLPLTLAAGADVVSAYLTGVRNPEAELPLLWFTPGVRMVRYFAETYTRADGLPVTDPCAATTSVTVAG